MTMNKLPIRSILGFGVIGVALCASGCGGDSSADAPDADLTKPDADPTVIDAAPGTPDAGQTGIAACFPLSATMIGDAGDTKAILRNPYLLGAICPSINDGSEGTGSQLLRFSHVGDVYTIHFLNTTIGIRSVSAGTLTFSANTLNDTVDGVPADTDVTLTTMNGDVIVVAFAGEEVTVKSWTPPAGVVVPGDIDVVGGCVERRNTIALRMKIFFDGPGMVGKTIMVDATGLDDDGAETFTGLSNEINPQGAVLLSFDFSEPDFTFWAKLTLGTLELITKDAGDNDVVTDILGAVNTSFGQQPELHDDTGELTGSDLPVGTYQWNAHAASTTFGDCVVPYRR